MSLLTSYRLSKKIIIFIIYSIALIVLSIINKDNIINKINNISEPNLLIKNDIPSETTIDVFFSPNQGASDAIIKAISEAKNTIFIAAYTFTSTKIAQALLNAQKRNVKIKLIFDKSQASQKYSASTFFINQGFLLRFDISHAIYHHKYMIIDGITVITGSFNFTKAAEHKNAENVLIIRNHPKLAQRYIKSFELDWEKSLSKEELF